MDGESNSSLATLELAGGVAPPTAPKELFSDLFAELSDETRNLLADPQIATLGVKTDSSAAAHAPKAPLSLKDSGLSRMQVCDLILKQIYLHGNLLGVDIAKNARLPYNLIDESLRFLKDEKCIEVTSGDFLGRASYRFSLTEMGRTRAREAFEQCRYVGPAPVPLESYVAQCRSQAVAGIKCDAERLVEAFHGMIIGPELLDEVGPAVCSGRSIFIYGPPGNGKSTVARGLGRFLNKYSGDIYVPYAITTENSIITIFDPTLHLVTDHCDQETSGTREAVAGDQRQKLEATVDLRWRRVRRPVVITGGELTLDQLELRYNKVSNFYQAPVQMKANGGVFLIDDFGRQIVSPKDLLNRWIVPLEERIDYLTLATGKKFSVPFELLIIFSTNLDPHELVDEAFLRRIRHKIRIGPPSREMYSQIFQLACEQRNLPFDERAVQYLFANHYAQGRTPRSSDPRDLLEIAQSICRFRNQRFVLSQKLMEEATSRFFCEV
jgi:energy-coupling factor transporter ATP-binding protein EcfA2